MTIYVITLDTENCIGCGQCELECPDNWKMVDGKAKFEKAEIDDSAYESNKKAADSCPVTVIKIEAKDGAAPSSGDSSDEDAGEGA
ncbi:MAG: ferredoxin [Nanoarchaeota archaeon]|nr:ferredoxin [Nanoarchaeota archaeon]